MLTPSKPGTFRLKQPPLSQPPEDSLLLTVAVNHEPPLTPSNNTSVRSVPKDANRYELTVGGTKDRLSEWVYEGRKREVVDSYIARISGQGSNLLLEPLSEAYDFNLVSMPEGNDAKPGFRHIDQRHAEQGFYEESKSDLEKDDPDETNEFDYRHFLRPSSTHVSNSDPTLTKDEASVTAFTSRIAKRPPTSVIKADSRTKNLPQTLVNDRERVKMGHDGWARSDDNGIDGGNDGDEGDDAKGRDNADDVNGGLIIEGEPVQKSKKKRRNFTPLTDGPTSLHAAAAARSLDTDRAGSYEDDGEHLEKSWDTDEGTGYLESPIAEAENMEAPLRRQSTWDEAAYEAAIEEAFRGEGDENSPIANEHRMSNQESESESEEE